MNSFGTYMMELHFTCRKLKKTSSISSRIYYYCDMFHYTATTDIPADNYHCGAIYRLFLYY